MPEAPDKLSPEAQLIEDIVEFVGKPGGDKLAVSKIKDRLKAYDAATADEADSNDAIYREKAIEKYVMTSDGDVNIDDDAVVSIGNDGAYVASWLFVSKELAGLEDDEDEDDGEDDDTFVVQHELDTEPTYVGMSNDPDGDYVTLGKDIPAHIRLRLGPVIAQFLNETEGSA